MNRTVHWQQRPGATKPCVVGNLTCPMEKNCEAGGSRRTRRLTGETFRRSIVISYALPTS